ncbi:alanine/glycine:cation symporter family protein [Colwellia sp. KU-HH00111]|uniref:alanine/glycine:cation symporter family protein n=1 Tax=Colwellia sp. KU-HH00111 TaxID=3127652 RepID=UPI0033653E9D
MSQIVNFINSILWDSLLVYMLVGTGIWFSCRLKLLQFSHFFHMFSVLKNGATSNSKGISAFQALMTSLAARVGTGNLAGVAIAISLGGAGAVFWMWIIALLGMVTGYAESLLGQLYKVKDSQGQYRGGPAYYIKMGLKKPMLAAIFSACIFIGYGLVFSSTQANTMADALSHAYQVPPSLSGLIIILLAGLIILGGVRMIARCSSILVPIMGISYLALALYICIVNYALLPDIIVMIYESAFGLTQAGSGALGAAIINGVKRGLYSNEAGAGTVPHAAACAASRHPAAQGYVQMLGVFIDTIVVCTATAMIILLAQNQLGNEGLTGIRLTQSAVSEHVGAWGSDFITIAICLFSFTSIVANYVYAESNLVLFKFDNTMGRTVFTLVFLTMTFWGANASLPEVWAIADLSLGLTTLINITALMLLSTTIIAVTKDYHHQRKTVALPRFNRDKVNDVQGKLAKDVW